MLYPSVNGKYRCHIHLYRAYTDVVYTCIWHIQMLYISLYGIYICMDLSMAYTDVVYNCIWHIYMTLLWLQSYINEVLCWRFTMHYPYWKWTSLCSGDCNPLTTQPFFLNHTNSHTRLHIYVHRETYTSSTGTIQEILAGVSRYH